MRRPENARVGLCASLPAPVALPDESRWDETTCNLAVCQHPQCWAAIRRIERGHPRLLGAPCKTSETEDKLPTLTIVNLSDVCIPACRLARHRPLPRLASRKPRSLRPQGPAFGSRFSGRPQKTLHDKDFISGTGRAPKRTPLLKKLPVLNLNDTQLPYSQDLENMVLIWIPEAPDYQVMSTKQKEGKSLLVPERPVFTSGKESRPESANRPPPPSPEYFSEPVISARVPVWNRFALEYLELLQELSSGKAKTEASLEGLLPLDIMGNSQPDIGDLTGMFLTVQGLTLQAPAKRYPLRKFYSKSKAKGQRKPQRGRQQPKEKVKPPQKQAQWREGAGAGGPEAAQAWDILGGKEEMQPSMSETASQNAWQSADLAVQQRQEREKQPVQPVKMVSPRDIPRISVQPSMMDSSESAEMEHQKFLNSAQRKEVTREKLPVQSVTSDDQLPELKPPVKAVSDEVEVVLKVHRNVRGNLFSSSSVVSWNPELRLLRILQDKEKDVEGDHESESESESEFVSAGKDGAASSAMSKGSQDS